MSLVLSVNDVIISKAVLSIFIVSNFFSCCSIYVYNSKKHQHIAANYNSQKVYITGPPDEFLWMALDHRHTIYRRSTTVYSIDYILLAYILKALKEQYTVKNLKQLFEYKITFTWNFGGQIFNQYLNAVHFFQH